MFSFPSPLLPLKYKTKPTPTPSPDLNPHLGTLCPHSAEAPEAPSMATRKETRAPLRTHPGDPDKQPRSSPSSCSQGKLPQHRSQSHPMAQASQEEKACRIVPLLPSDREGAGGEITSFLRTAHGAHRSWFKLSSLPWALLRSSGGFRKEDKFLLPRASAAPLLPASHHLVASKPGREDRSAGRPSLALADPDPPDW